MQNKENNILAKRRILKSKKEKKENEFVQLIQNDSNKNINNYENLNNFNKKLVLLKNNTNFQNIIEKFEYYLNLSIENDNNEKMEKYKTLKLNDSYLAGFIDGDGHIFIHKHFKDNEQNNLEKQVYRYGISIGQTRTNVLQIIKYYFYGNIYNSSVDINNILIDENGKFYKNNTRQMFIYQVNSYFSQYLLNFIYDSLVIKKPQIDTIYNFNYYNKEHEFLENEDKFETLADICQDNIDLHNLQNPKNYDYNFHNINIQYIAGLFDAEGCISLVAPFGDKYFSPKLSISQKNYPKVLEKIIEFLGYGNIENNNSFTISGIKAYELINQIIDLTIVKYNQLMIIKMYYEHKDLLNEDNNLFFVEFVKRLLNKEKHEGEDFKDEKDKNIDGFLDIVDNELIKIVDGKKILKSSDEIKSENMIGNKNHFYGKHFSDSHKLNLGKSIANSRRDKNLSDENIYFIKEKIKENKKPGEIIEELKLKGFNIKHYHIRDIRNDLIRPINDYNSKKEKSEKDIYFENIDANKKTSIGKRTIQDFGILIELILWKKSIHNSYKDTRDKTENYKNITKWNKNRVLEEGETKKLLGIPLLVDYLNINFDYKVTFHIIKNLWDGRSELFKEEFDFYKPNDFTHEEYREIIAK